MKRSKTSRTIPNSYRHKIIENGKLVGYQNEKAGSRGFCDTYLSDGQLYCFVYEDETKIWLVFIVSFDISELEIFVDDVEETKRLIAE